VGSGYCRECATTSSFFAQAMRRCGKVTWKRSRPWRASVSVRIFEFHLVWDGRVLKGYEGTLEWLADTRETWEEYSQEVEEIIDLGEQVVVVLRLSARGAGSGVPVAEELAVAWTFEGDRAVRARSFASRAAALESARQAP
jgi:ketosteroid isomerase-like protein